MPLYIAESGVVSMLFLAAENPDLAEVRGKGLTTLSQSLAGDDEEQNAAGLPNPTSVNGHSQRQNLLVPCSSGARFFWP